MKYKRIVIFGLTASGKTTLAKSVSKILKIKVYHTDNLAYKRKWDIKSSEKEFKKELNKILKKDKWILEGVHSEWILKAVKQADLVIFLDKKKITMTKRALKRSKKNKDNLKQKLKLLYWIFRWGSKWYRKCEQYSKSFIELKNKEQINKFLKSLK